MGAVDWSGVARGVPPGGAFDDVAAAVANRAVGNPPGAPLIECALSGPRVRALRDVVCAWVCCGESRHFEMKRGEEIQIGRIAKGLRGYLAAGDLKRDGEQRGCEERLTIRAIAGPHRSDIRELVCEVTPQLDRVGIRMRVVEPAGLSAPGMLPSCGMQCGTIQLHPDGSAVAMGPDHPVTGGYLQPMTVISSERWKLAQLAPGERVRFLAQLP